MERRMPRIRTRTKTTCGWSTVWSMVRAARGRRAAAAAWGGQAPMYIHLVKSAECVSRRPTQTAHQNPPQKPAAESNCPRFNCHDSPGRRHNWRRESQPQQQLGGGRGEDSSPSTIVRGLFVAQPPSRQSCMVTAAVHVQTMRSKPSRNSAAVSLRVLRAALAFKLMQRRSEW
jgi:hypothetical protein